MAQAGRETRVVEAVVSPDISPEQIRELVFQAGILGGRDCRTCGLIGVDLRLTGQDPEHEEISGVRSIVVS